MSMNKWNKDWLLILHKLLFRKGGYEIVRALMMSEGNKQIENEIVAETGGPESTVEEWLQDARGYGLVESDVGEKDGQMVRIWKLKRERVPNEIEPLIDDRGKVWRDEDETHGDVAGHSTWLTGPNLGNILVSLDPDEEGYVTLDDIDFGGEN